MISHLSLLYRMYDAPVRRQFVGTHVNGWISSPIINENPLKQFDSGCSCGWLHQNATASLLLPQRLVKYQTNHDHSLASYYCYLLISSFDAIDNSRKVPYTEALVAALKNCAVHYDTLFLSQFAQLIKNPYIHINSSYTCYKLMSQHHPTIDYCIEQQYKYRQHVINMLFNYTSCVEIVSLVVKYADCINFSVQIAHLFGNASPSLFTHPNHISRSYPPSRMIYPKSSMATQCPIISIKFIEDSYNFHTYIASQNVICFILPYMISIANSWKCIDDRNDTGWNMYSIDLMNGKIFIVLMINQSMFWHNIQRASLHTSSMRKMLHFYGMDCLVGNVREIQLTYTIAPMAAFKTVTFMNYSSIFSLCDVSQIFLELIATNNTLLVTLSNKTIIIICKRLIGLYDVDINMETLISKKVSFE
eukprot:349382_1